MASGDGIHGPRPRRRIGLRALAFALLLGEVLVIIVPSVYARSAPKLFGFPFFYWFQLLWIIVAMVVTGIAYLLVERAEADRGGAAPQAGGRR